MATFVIEDISGKVNAVMFPKILVKYGSELVEDQIVGINGKLDNRRGQYQIMCDTAKILSLETMIENAKKQDIFKPEDKSDIGVRLLDDILAEDDEPIETENVTEKPLDELPHETFLIEIPLSMPQDRMKDLNILLQNNKGDTPVELILSSANKRIKLPFGIKLSTGLKSSIQELVI